MDLDQVRKINDLSNELKKHGMVDSSTDAYQQAEQMIQVIPKQEATQDNGSQVVVQEAPKDSLAERQFRIELERMQKAMREEIDIMRNAMNQIITEVNALRDDLSNLQNAQPPKSKEKQKELKTETKEPHPRQGNFSSKDVDIQKMFYFGNK